MRRERGGRTRSRPSARSGDRHASSPVAWFVGAVVLGALVLGVTLVGIALGGPAVGTAVAGDQLAVVDPVPHEVEVDPGETFEVDVVVRSWGGHGGTGVEAIALRAQYHPDVLEVTDVDIGTWLESEDGNVETEVTMANDRGVTEVRQYEEPSAGGSTGEAVFATLTVRVAENAPPSNATIDLGETTAELEGEQPLAILERPVTVVVDGGDESRGSAEHDDVDGIDDLEDESLAADDENGEAAGIGERVGPGLAVAVGGVVLAGLFAVAVVRRRRLGRGNQ